MAGGKPRCSCPAHHHHQTLSAPLVLVPSALTTAATSSNAESGAFHDPASQGLAVKELGRGTEYGVHDALREGLRCVRAEVSGAHPLETQLSQVGPWA
jgi:hypothetical protein